MRLLDRYLLRELLAMFGLCLGGLIMVYVAFDILESLHHFQEKQLQAGDVAELYLVKIPGILVYILPITLLIALLYVLTNHTRHHELTAMRAAGVSLWRICAPYLAVGFLLSVAVFVMNELWVPDTEARVERIMNRHEPKIPGADAMVQLNLGFDNARDKRSWIIGAYDLRTDKMSNPQVFWKEQGADWHLVAQRAERIEGVWTFYGDTNSAYPVHLMKRDASTGFQMAHVLDTNRLAMPQFTETPKDFVNEIKLNSRLGTLNAETAEVPIVELLDYRNLHPDMSQRHRWWVETQLHGRFAEPWSCLVVVLVAIPFGAASGRRNIFMGVAGSIVICFIYFVLLKLGLALGTGGYLPGWAAAWLPNAVFGITGYWMILRVR